MSLAIKLCQVALPQIHIKPCLCPYLGWCFFKHPNHSFVAAVRRCFYQVDVPGSVTNFVDPPCVDWAVLFALCYIWFLGFLLQLKHKKPISLAQAVASHQMRPVIQFPCIGNDTKCQVKVCILGKSLLVWCFPSCSQQEDQTEEWAADSWREKSSGNLLLYFFHRENKKK